MSSVIVADELATDVTGAEAMVTQHQEYKAEIDTRQKSVSEFEQQAKKLVTSDHSAARDINEKSSKLQTSWVELAETWEKRKVELDKNLEVQTYIREADQVEGWINARSVDIECEDLGDSLEAVEELLKKHDEFEKMLMAQEEKFLGLQRLTREEEELRKLTEAEEKRRRDEVRRKEKELEGKKERERKERRMQKERKEQERRLEEKRKNQERVKREAEERRLIQEQKQRAEAEERIKRKEEERQRLEEAEKLRIKEQKLREEKAKAEKMKRAQELRQREEEQKRREIDMQRAAEEQKQRQREERKFDQNRNRPYGTRSPPEVIRNGSPVANKNGFSGPLCEGILQRKQELEVGGRKSQTRAWKTYFTVIKGHQLLFFREKKDLQTKNYAAPPLNLREGFCEEASDYTKRKNAMRVILTDGSEYLFIARDASDLKRWVKNISSITDGEENGLDDDLPASPPPPRFNTPPLSRDGRSSPSIPRNAAPTFNPVITITTPDEETEDEGPPTFAPPPPPAAIPQPVVAPSDFAAPDNLPPPIPDISLMPEDGDDGLDNVLTAFPDDLPPDIPPPDIPPPDIPPPDIPPPNIPDIFDEEGIPDAPSTPPPLDDSEVRSPNGIYLEVDSDDEDLDDLPSPSPPAYVPSQLEGDPEPPPRRKQRAPPPPSKSGVRSDSQESRSLSDSLDKLADNIPVPIPLLAAKPGRLAKTSALGKQQSVDSDSDTGHAHEEKKRDKKKGMFGNIFKKKR